VFIKKKQNAPKRTRKSAQQLPSRFQPPRSKKVLPASVIEKQTWSCPSCCYFVFTDLVDFLKHIKEAHDFLFVTGQLAPLGLGLCPYCNGVFSARGMPVHTHACTYPRSRPVSKEM